MDNSAALSTGEQREAELASEAARALIDILGTGWNVHARPARDRGVDFMLTLSGPDQGAEALIAVEVKRNLTPSTAAHSLISQLERSRRRLGDKATAIVVSEWLSPRTRQVLDKEGIGYLDTTGNVSLQIPEPRVVIRTEGQQRDPRPRSQVRRGISGPRAGRVVRQLVDFQPPRRAAELAAASDISESYASRLLDILSEEALIRRKNRVIVTVDWRNLLRARASSYQLMKANRVVATVARRGLDATLEAVRNHATAQPVLMTGIWAADHYVPIVVGGQPMLYVRPGEQAIEQVMKDLGLLATNSAKMNTLQLLQPPDDGPWERTGPYLDGLPTAGMSQLVLDCLAGPGRMPAAGEALLQWMAERENEWRLPSPLFDHAATPLN